MRVYATENCKDHRLQINVKFAGYLIYNKYRLLCLITVTPSYIRLHPDKRYLSQNSEHDSTSSAENKRLIIIPLLRGRAIFSC
jgi:hypothetical protein